MTLFRFYFHDPKDSGDGQQKDWQCAAPNLGAACAKFCNSFPGIDAFRVEESGEVTVVADPPAFVATPGAPG